MVVDKDGTVNFEGLPAQFEYNMNTFSDEEKKNGPLDCLSAAIREREGMGRKDIEPQDERTHEEEEKSEIPDEEKAKKMINFDLKSDDPSKYYDIIERIGVGGFAKVFKVKRKEDDAFCALKFVEPKTTAERDSILNEVGIMLLCKQNDAIVKCFECFDFKNRLWIFLEMMDGGALT